MIKKKKKEISAIKRKEAGTFEQQKKKKKEKIHCEVSKMKETEISKFQGNKRGKGVPQGRYGWNGKW